MLLTTIALTFALLAACGGGGEEPAPADAQIITPLTLNYEFTGVAGGAFTSDGAAEILTEALPSSGEGSSYEAVADQSWLTSRVVAPEQPGEGTRVGVSVDTAGAPTQPGQHLGKVTVTETTTGTTVATVDVALDVAPPATVEPGSTNVGQFGGMNLEGPADWARSVAFTDVFKMSRMWVPQLVNGSAWDTGTAINTDANGWVTSLAPGDAVATAILTEQEGNYQQGRYVCLYEGDAGTNASSILISGDATKVAGTYTPGRFEVDYNPTNGGLVILKIIAINPADHIRNIRLIMPGFESTYNTTNVFHPDFLESLSPFKILRFMDWGQTNNSPITTWASRIPATGAQYTGGFGIPLEVMIALCNKLDADMWYCIPHQADDNYVTQASRLIRDTLKPGLRLFLEYSNEVWNWIFEQAAYAHAQGQLLWPGDQAAWYHYHSLRTAQVMDLALAEFSGAQRPRLVRILGTQGEPFISQIHLDWEITGPNDLTHQHVDALAIAPYFGYELGLEENQATVQAMSVDDVLDAADAASVARNGPGGPTAQINAQCTARGLKLIAYEGGQHLAGVGATVNNTTITNLFQAANRHPRMREIYRDDLARWTASGGELFAFFAHVARYTQWGSWGILEQQNQDRSTAPKWLGIEDWLATFTR